MKENAIMDSIQRQLIKKYHAVAHAAGLSDDERRSILEAYGVESSRDLSQHDLIDIIAKISHDMPGNLDKLRKRLIASIGAVCWWIPLFCAIRSPSPYGGIG